MNPSMSDEAWQLLITEDILEKFLEHTNAKITELSSRYRSDNASFTNHEDIVELRVFKSGREKEEISFEQPCPSSDFYFFRLLYDLTIQATVPKDLQLVKLLHLISDIFQKFVNNCEENCTCSEYATVDEMLVPFRGKNSLRQRNNPRELSVPTLAVLSLVKPIENTNRNVTGDNWFTSNELVNELKSKGLTYVGTVRKNKRVPPEFQAHKRRETESIQQCATNARASASNILLKKIFALRVIMTKMGPVMSK
ncbi:PREDICTED: uncharacterized protein LOC108576951 [Habropoda laboriosa]|uniref:uncharacterized protein LOC108576951 n=1 Tax=Habropoda laboriosa TaxID=597456 RepID=UPI00083D8A89|nr:PREDICTED: uncharacterized protein LOC108576951 [Habropoda laboriosa]